MVATVIKGDENTFSSNHSNHSNLGRKSLKITDLDGKALILDDETRTRPKDRKKREKKAKEDGQD
jgi:hypothetical protein